MLFNLMIIAVSLNAAVTVAALIKKAHDKNKNGNM